MVEWYNNWSIGRKGDTNRCAQGANPVSRGETSRFEWKNVGMVKWWHGVNPLKLEIFMAIDGIHHNMCSCAWPNTQYDAPIGKLGPICNGALLLALCLQMDGKPRIASTID